MMCTVPQMRKEQMRARMISSIHVKLLHLPVKHYYCSQTQEQLKKTSTFFLLQMSVQGRIFLGLILVTVWTVEGK